MKRQAPNSDHQGPTNRQSITLLVSGDVMIGRGIDQVLPQSVNPVLYERYIKNALKYVKLAQYKSGPIPKKISYDYIWGDALIEMQRRNPDIKIINLETAITTSDDYWQQKEIHYRMHPKNIRVLTKANINVCVLGNNHILDWGFDGLRDTLNVLEKNHLLTTGAGLNIETAAKPAIVNTSKGRLLVFSYASTSAGTPTSWKVTEDKPGVNLLEKLNHKTATKIGRNINSFYQDGDRVVVSIHWGANFGYDIPNDQQAFARHLIDTGLVDLIHGHSSHHPKGIEVYNKRLILYGCGDLINDYEGINGHEEYRDDLSLLYFVEMDTSGALNSLIMTPMKIHRFRLQHANHYDTQWIADQLKSKYRKFSISFNSLQNNVLKLLF